MSDQKWKQIVGKSISEGAYISSFELKESYAKVMKMTTIITNGNGKVSKLSEEVIKLQKEIDDLKLQNQRETDTFKLQIFNLQSDFNSLVSALEESKVNAKKLMKDHEEKYSEDSSRIPPEEETEE